MQVRREAKYQGVLATIGVIWQVCFVSLLEHLHMLVTHAVQFQQRGTMGFFDGASLRMTRKVFSSAIGWAVYEGVLLALRTSASNSTH